MMKAVADHYSAVSAVVQSRRSKSGDASSAVLYTSPRSLIPSIDTTNTEVVSCTIPVRLFPP